jgi:hypothetical protein
MGKQALCSALGSPLDSVAPNQQLVAAEKTPRKNTALKHRVKAPANTGKRRGDSKT